MLKFSLYSVNSDGNGYVKETLSFSAKLALALSKRFQYQTAFVFSFSSRYSSTEFR